MKKLRIITEIAGLGAFSVAAEKLLFLTSKYQLEWKITRNTNERGILMKK